MKIIDILYETKFPVSSPFYILSIHFLWWNRHFCLCILHILVVFKDPSYLHSRLGKPSRTSIARPSCRRLDRLLQPSFDMRVAAAAADNESLATKKWGNRVSKSTPIQDWPVCSKPSELLCKLWDWYQSRMATSGEQWFDFVEKIYRENTCFHPAKRWWSTNRTEDKWLDFPGKMGWTWLNSSTHRLLP